MLRYKLALSNNYLSRGSLLYILDTVKDLYNDYQLKDALIRQHIYYLINQHPFIDGNKRTAFGIADLLRLNG